jgi:hypothetical protein
MLNWHLINPDFSDASPFDCNMFSRYFDILDSHLKRNKHYIWRKTFGEMWAAMNCLKHRLARLRSRNGEDEQSFEIKAIGTMKILVTSYVISSRNYESPYSENRDSPWGIHSWYFDANEKIQVNTQYTCKNLVFIGKSPGLRGIFPTRWYFQSWKSSDSKSFNFLSFTNSIFDLGKILASELVFIFWPVKWISLCKIETRFLPRCYPVSFDFSLCTIVRHWMFSPSPCFVFHCEIYCEICID